LLQKVIIIFNKDNY